MNGKAIAAASLLLASGCVSSTRYKESQAQLGSWKGKAEALDARRAALEGELAQARASEAELRAKLASSEEQVASLKKSVADLQDGLESKKGELSRRISALVAEKDETAQKLAQAQSSIAELDRKVAAALEEKAAAERAKEQEVAKVMQGYEELASGLKAEIADGAVKLTQLKDKLTVQLVDRILFDSGSAQIKPGGRKVLGQIGELLSRVQGKDLRIEGHTDNVPISGELKSRYASNWELSTARATAVARYLQDEARLEPHRLIAAGYGEHRPVSPNDKPESRALNRRIEIVLVNRD